MGEEREREREREKREARGGQTRTDGMAASRLNQAPVVTALPPACPSELSDASLVLAAGTSQGAATFPPFAFPPFPPPRRGAPPVRPFAVAVQAGTTAASAAGGDSRRPRPIGPRVRPPEIEPADYVQREGERERE